MRREELISNICEKIGIRNRRKCGSGFFSKLELYHLAGWIDTLLTKIRNEETKRGNEPYKK